MTVAKHHIVTNDDALPVYQSPYRVFLKEKELIQEQVQEMHKQQRHPVFEQPLGLSSCACQEGGTLRFCVDHCRLNAVTKRVVYPLPRIYDSLDRLHHTQYFRRWI